MKIRMPLSLLSVGVILGVLLGCSSEPATPTAASAPAPRPTEVVATAESVPKATEAVVAANSEPRPTEVVVVAESVPKPTEVVVAVDSEPKAEVVEVGYDVGLRAPEFGMSLVAGSRVTSSSLSEDGKPVVLYFHANF